MIASVDFLELVERFFRERTLKASSMRAYRIDLGDLQRYICDADGLSMQDIHTIQREPLRIYLEQSCGARAAQRKATNIRQFMLWLRDSAGMDILPEWELKWDFRYTATKTHTQIIITPDIYKRIERIDMRIAFAVRLIWETAISLGELTTLSWTDIQGGHIVLQRNGLRRIVTLSDDILKYISDLKDSHNGETILATRDDLPMTEGYLSLRIRRILRDITAQDISIYDLQRSALHELTRRAGITETSSITGRRRAESMIDTITSSARTSDISDERRLYLRTIHRQVYGY